VLYASHQEAGRLIAECAPDLPLIEGDATLLRQVIHNLVQNALDAVEFLPGGQVRISTRVKYDEHGGINAVRLAVNDNGPGFPDRILKRAFEPYVTTKQKGTGLGLAVVKKIADEHGAIVRLSNPNQAANTEQTSPESVQTNKETQGGAQVSLSFSRLSPVAADAATHL
jgi:nitrogen fixation/metabolism regulation signal transduction histidine kinase